MAHRHLALVSLLDHAKDADYVAKTMRATNGLNLSLWAHTVIFGYVHHIKRWPVQVDEQASADNMTVAKILGVGESTLRSHVSRIHSRIARGRRPKAGDQFFGLFTPRQRNYSEPNPVTMDAILGDDTEVPQRGRTRHDLLAFCRFVRTDVDSGFRYAKDDILTCTLIAVSTGAVLLTPKEWSLVIGIMLYDVDPGPAGKASHILCFHPSSAFALASLKDYAMSMQERWGNFHRSTPTPFDSAPHMPPSLPEGRAQKLQPYLDQIRDAFSSSNALVYTNNRFSASRLATPEEAPEQLRLYLQGLGEVMEGHFPEDRESWLRAGIYNFTAATQVLELAEAEAKHSDSLVRQIRDVLNKPDHREALQFAINTYLDYDQLLPAVRRCTRAQRQFLGDSPTTTVLVD